MSKLLVSVATATRALAMLKAHGSPNAAAYDARLTLISIAPYTDRATVKVLRVLELVARATDPAPAIAKLTAIAGGTT